MDYLIAPIVQTVQKPFARHPIVLKLFSVPEVLVETYHTKFEFNQILVT